VVAGLGFQEPLTCESLDEFGKRAGWCAGKVVAAVVNRCAHEACVLAALGAEPSNHLADHCLSSTAEPDNAIASSSNRTPS
jgi:hypothetical protein